MADLSPHRPLRLPVPNRPLTLMDTFDGAFEIVRIRPRVAVTLVLVLLLPLQLLGVWLRRDFFAELGALNFSNLDLETGTFDGAGTGGDFGFQVSDMIGAEAVLPWIALPFLGVAMTHLVQGWFAGHDRSAMDCLRFTLSKTPIILAACVLTKAIQLVSVALLVIPLLFAVALLQFVAPVIATDEVGPVGAIRRSVTLAKRNMGRSISVTILVVVVNWIVSSATGSVPQLIAFFLGSWAWVGFVLSTTVTAMLTTMISVGVSVLHYFDVLHRTEGRDIDRRLTRLDAGSAQSSPVR